jgi:hypothetical protein
MSDTPQPMNRDQADSKGIDPSEEGQKTAANVQKYVTESGQAGKQ